MISSRKFTAGVAEQSDIFLRMKSPGLDILHVCWKATIILVYAVSILLMTEYQCCKNILATTYIIMQSTLINLQGNAIVFWNRGTFLKIKGILWHLSDNLQGINWFYFCGVSIDCWRKVKAIAYVLVTPWSALHQLSCQDSKWAQFNQANGLKCWLIVLRSERVSAIAKSSRDGWWCLVVQKTPYQAMDVQFCGEHIVRGARGMSPT